jgi:hypothetical protein
MGTGIASLLLFLIAGADAAPARGSERVIHRFDFDERPEGNLEKYPKYWERMTHPKFSLFAEGGFDLASGHTAPPSFHLASRGRDVAFAYMGRAARVEQGKRFRVEGFIRPDQLEFGRACLSAAYRKNDGTIILETLVRSPYIGGEPDGWQTVELYLPQAPADAEAITITAWVLQEATWNAQDRSWRDIARVDVEGGAWFDDIVIVALPRIDVRVADGLNVIGPADRAELQVVVDDHNLHELDLLLTIVDPAGGTVYQSKLKKADFAKGSSRVPLSLLSPGVYRAILRVAHDEQLIDARETQFAILAELPEAPRAGTPQFGMVLQPGARLAPPLEAKLLTLQQVRAAKVPIIIPSELDTQERGDDQLELLHELIRRGFDITTVLLPQSKGAAAQTSRRALETFARNPARWEGELATAAARYAGIARWWQLGTDGAALDGAAAALEPAVINVREVLDRYALGAQLAAAWSLHEDVLSGPRIEGVTLLVDGAPDGALSNAVEELRSRGTSKVSALAGPLSGEEYARLPRLAEWVKRLLLSRHAGADAVYVPQTWSVHASYEGLVGEPAEEFVLLRTIAGLLGDSQPGPQIAVDSVRMLAFCAGESTVLAIWDEAAPPEGRDATLQLGRATHSVDPWGKRVELARVREGQHLIRLSQMPVLVPDVESWLIDLLTSIHIEPPRAAPGAETARHTLKIDYRGNRPLAATVRLTRPEAWHASPPAFQASLSPHEPLEIPFELRRPHNEPSGSRRIMAEVRVENPSYFLEIPIPFEIALEDVEVRGTALLVGDDLVLRHAVRNTGSQPLHLRSAAAVPGRQRQYRPIVNLTPGESETVEYHFRDSEGLSGRQVYLTVRELDDGPRSHTLQVVVP